MTINDQDQQIQELIAFNQELLKEIESQNQFIRDLLKTTQEAVSLLNTQKTNEKMEDEPIIEYLASCYLSDAKLNKNKRASIFLLKLIKKQIIRKKPITGSSANYLVSAIDNIVRNPKVIDAKKAFLLNGTMSTKYKVQKYLNSNYICYI